MNLPIGTEAQALSDTQRNSVVESAHRAFAPEVWRDLLARERALVTHEDVLSCLGVADDSELALLFAEDHVLEDYEFDRLVASAKDEIAMERAQAKLSHEVWRRANEDAQ